MAKDHDLGLSRDIATTADEDLQHGAEGKEEKPEGHHRILTNSHKAALQSQDPNIGTLQVVKVSPPSIAEVARLRSGSVLIGFLGPVTAPELLAALTAAGVTAFAFESIPRISRAQSMDALSSQATVSGYRGALLAADHLTRFFPMLTTAAGTVPPARVLVMGAGVAGLEALAVARRLGARTTGYDVRPEAADQVGSVGASWLDGGGARLAAFPAPRPAGARRSGACNVVPAFEIHPACG